MIKSTEITKAAKEVNKLMNGYGITSDVRILYLTGSMLALKNGLKSEQLIGGNDGALIIDNIHQYVSKHVRENDYVELVASAYAPLTMDKDRDKPIVERAGVKVSITHDVYAFIEHNVFDKVDTGTDFAGEMYTSFLSKSLVSGKDNDIVFTPKYTTDLMADLIGVTTGSRVLDLCTGSGGFLLTALEQGAKDHLAFEIDPKMFSLAVTNMLLRGDDVNVIKGDAMSGDYDDVITQFEPDVALINPPYSYEGNGMPFALKALDSMVTGGKVALIIQDSAGTGRATKVNKELLGRHTLVSNIRMPADLFQPAAGVQTSIYIFKAHTPHDYDAVVRFIDFSDDGYKRTKRGISSTGNPERAYEEVRLVYNEGLKCDIEFIDDVITEAGDDWNYTQHRVIDTTPTEADFMKTVGDYLQWEMSRDMELLSKGRGV